MSRCSKGKSCGQTCIERKDLCRKTLNPTISRELSRVGLADIFNLAIQQGAAGQKEETIKLPSDSLLFDDIDRLLRGEEPLVMQDTRPANKGDSPESRLRSALGMGTLTRREVGSDRRVLVEEAQRVKKQIENKFFVDNVLILNSFSTNDTIYQCSFHN